MGGNNSTRRVSFESDENDNVTIVKGIRLSENVINPIIAPPSPVDLPPQPATVDIFAPPPLPPVNEEELRRKIAEELQQGLEQERSERELEMLQRLDEEKAQVKAQAETRIQDEVGRILDVERAANQETIKRVVLKERITAEDERLRAQFYAHQLEERDRELRKQDAFYREQVAKLEERSAKFYRVTTENYHRAADEVNAKFKRYEIKPICADLQGQILRCYRENTGQTLSCSRIASLYLQCVNDAKQNKMRTGVYLSLHCKMVHGFTATQETSNATGSAAPGDIWKQIPNPVWFQCSGTAVRLKDQSKGPHSPTPAAPPRRGVLLFPLHSLAPHRQ
ncbi:hypothetical protein SKAU_G00023840 [Synaphobranchus kaupii]|uniref:MICOS complex subunit MIC19 n=1 Tax=Synaphobranchus kaupii TaxID=118154 RepID=A0A9Q1GDM1_SYNKA|nr:hypothetical protein SKAU_G00023840 [Synaphobranchus kaupii]